MYSCFDANHWHRVKKARQEQGLNRLSHEASLRPNHALTNSVLRNKKTGEQWSVVSVREDWLYGRFLVALLERNGSHRTCFVENISSEAVDVLNGLAVFHSEFEVVDD